MPERDTAYELSAPERGSGLKLPRELLEPQLGKPSPLARNAVIIVAGSGPQAAAAAPAAQLYADEMVKLSCAYASVLTNIGSARHWYLMSAKHGLLRPDQVVEPYAEIWDWKYLGGERARAMLVKIWFDLARVSDVKPSTLIILADPRIVDVLGEAASRTGMKTEVPLLDLKPGPAKLWLAGQLKKLGVS